MLVLEGQAAVLLLFLLCVLIASSCFGLMSNKMWWHKNWAYWTDDTTKSPLEWNGNPRSNSAAVQFFRNCVTDFTQSLGALGVCKLGPKQNTCYLLSSKPEISANLMPVIFRAQFLFSPLYKAIFKKIATKPRGNGAPQLSWLLALTDYFYYFIKVTT